MSFHRWLQNLRSILAPNRGERRKRRQSSHRVASFRPNLEVLEVRSLLAFTPAASFPVGPNPQALVAGDFNNDGYLDFAMANGGNTTVSVLLGDGQGGFGAAIVSDAGSLPSGESWHSLAVGDFNGDGDLDLAVASGYQGWDDEYGQMNILWGIGNGTFESPYVMIDSPLGVLGAGNFELAAGDFDNDGGSDILSGRGPLVEVFLNYGVPSGELLYQTSVAQFTPIVGDVNGDGNLDVVVSDFDNHSVVLIMGNGDGTFCSPAVLPYRECMAIGDFTGDGIPDLVVTGWHANWDVNILVGHGDGTFDTPISQTFDASSLAAVADFNSDGNVDMVAQSSRMLLGNGDGTLTPAGTLGLSLSDIVVGDFNGDGRPDVAGANFNSNTVSVLLNDGGPWTPPPPSVRIGDVTVTEGNTGIVAATFAVTLSAASTQSITVAYATGNGTATAGSDYQTASGTLTFAAGETSKTINVMVNGDRLAEPNETFVINLGNPTNATIAHGQGVGTIVDDEPRISVGDVSKTEGKKNQSTLFTFTVTLSTPYDQAVTMSFRTADGTAKTSDNDYVAKTGTLTFKPGEMTKTITIEVKGDSKKEANETFYLDLFGNGGNSSFQKNRGIGSILNDD